MPWSDVLFPGGDLQVTEPSGALLHAVGELYPGLLRHLSTLPDRALVDWLERRLGIARLPVVPDTVVAVPKPDPKRLPVVVPAGTALRGGRDAAGNERRYVTTETLTVLGTEVLDVRSYRTRRRRPRRSRTSEWIDQTRAVRAVPGRDRSVPHHADIVTDVIAFEGGRLNVRLRVRRARPEILPAGLVWWYSTPGRAGGGIGHRADAGKSVDLQLNGSCAPSDGRAAGVPFIRVALPEPPLPAGRVRPLVHHGDGRGRRARRASSLTPGSTTTDSSTSRRSSSRSGRWRSAATASTSRATRRSQAADLAEGALEMLGEGRPDVRGRLGRRDIRRSSRSRSTGAIAEEDSEVRHCQVLLHRPGSRTPATHGSSGSATTEPRGRSSQRSDDVLKSIVTSGLAPSARAARGSALYSRPVEVGGCHGPHGARIPRPRRLRLDRLPAAIARFAAAGGEEGAATREHRT